MLFRSLSHGRLYCGLGAGWYEHEWRAYGYGFPDLPDRMRAFRETCEIVVRMWTEEKANFNGRYYTIDGAINEPKGAQRPHIPLWIGGAGETVTLRLVARWGSASNFGAGNIDSVRQKMAVLRRHCEDLGRDFDTVERSTNLNVFILESGEDPERATSQARGKQSYEDFARGCFVGTIDDLAVHIEKLEAEGITYVITYFPRVAYDHSMMRRFAAEIMPRFSAD